MNRWAHIINGVVVNVVDGDVDFVALAAAGTSGAWAPAPPNVAIGDRFDGANFSTQGPSYSEKG